MLCCLRMLKSFNFKDAFSAITQNQKNYKVKVCISHAVDRQLQGSPEQQRSPHNVQNLPYKNVIFRDNCYPQGSFYGLFALLEYICDRHSPSSRIFFISNCDYTQISQKKDRVNKKAGKSKISKRFTGCIIGTLSPQIQTETTNQRVY